MSIISFRCVGLHVPCMLASFAATASLCAQESKALLHAPVAVLPVDSAPFQKLGDFDGDGDLDAVGSRVTANGAFSRVEFWRNDTGAFNPTHTIPWLQGSGMAQGPRSHAIAVTDLNGDGLDDVVMAAETVVERLLAQPGFQFTQQVWWLVGASAGRRAIATGDFDADGTTDVAVAAAGSVPGSERLFVFFGNGAWTFTAVPSLGNGTPHLEAHELDGLPGDDLLLSDRLQSTADIFTLSGGQLQNVQTLTSVLTQAAATPWLWMAGDIDGDGDVDVVVFRPSGAPGQLDSRYQIFRQTNASAFANEPIAFGGPAEYLVDIDSDGDLDGACCGGGGTTYTWPKLDFPSTFELTTNRGGGDFAPAFAFPGAGSESLAGAVDVDGDGDIDLVAGRCVFYGDGPWDAQPMPLAGGEGSSLVRRPGDLHDFDRDGDIDFYSVVNRGDGVFKDSAPEPAPPAGYVFLLDAIACDVDGDGARDRVHRLYQAAPGNAFVEMVWLRNNGGGHLTYQGALAPAGVMIGGPLGGGVDDIYVADFDADGDEDIFAQDTGELFWNQAGSFANPLVTLPVAGVIDGVADFNDDGLPDVLLSGPLVYFGVPRFGHYILEGTGQAATPFVSVWEGPSPWLSSPWPREPCATPIGDINGDGRLDFARLYNNSGIWLFINQSPPGTSPSFQNVQQSYVSVDLSAVPPYAARPTMSLGDIDGDGQTDIVVGRVNEEPNIGAVLRRTSTSPTQHTYEVIRLALPDGYAVDMDLDGDLDVVGERAVRNRQFGRDAGVRIQTHEGVAGEAGAMPVLGGTGPYEAGGWHTLRLSGVPGPTTALLGISLVEVALPDSPLPGMTLRIDPGTLITGSWPITESGFGRAAAMSAVPLPIFPAMQGWTFYLQAFVADVAAPQGFSQSNLLTIHVGS